jgi:hypothetical protein
MSLLSNGTQENRAGALPKNVDLLIFANWAGIRIAKAKNVRCGARGCRWEINIKAPKPSAQRLVRTESYLRWLCSAKVCVCKCREVRVGRPWAYAPKLYMVGRISKAHRDSQNEGEQSCKGLPGVKLRVPVYVCDTVQHSSTLKLTVLNVTS